MFRLSWHYTCQTDIKIRFFSVYHTPQQMAGLTVKSLAILIPLYVRLRHGVSVTPEDRVHAFRYVQVCRSQLNTLLYGKRRYS